MTTTEEAVTTHEVSLRSADGEALEVACRADESVLDAAQAAGIALPSLCAHGTCGACHATVTSGEYRLGEHSAAALHAADEARGDVLLCRTYAHGPLEVSLPYERSRIIFGSVPVRRGTIQTLEEIARDTVRLEVRVGPDADGSLGCQFEAGQFVELQVPGSDVRRSYSLANTGNWDGVLEFLIRLRPGGAFSTYLRRRARPGDVVTVHGPRGAFGLRETGMRPRWFIGGGTGLAPLLSMLRRMAEWQDPQPARLVVGVNEEADVFTIPGLRDVADALPGFEYQLCVWRPEPDGPWFHGTPVDFLDAALSTAREKPDIYVCGPPGLVDRVTDVAFAHGVSEDHVVRERYLPT